MMIKNGNGNGKLRPEQAAVLKHLLGRLATDGFRHPGSARLNLEEVAKWVGQETGIRGSLTPGEVVGAAVQLAVDRPEFLRRMAGLMGVAAAEE